VTGPRIPVTAGPLARSGAVGRLGDTVAVAVLVAVAGVGWQEVYGGRRWMLTVGAALLLGLAVAWLGAWRRLPALAVAAVAAVAFAVLGPPLALPGHPVPTPGALRLLLAGAVDGWRDLLTLVPPVGARGSLLVPAFLATFLAGLLAGSSALRIRRTWPALLSPAALLVGVGLLGTSRAVWPVLQGGVLIVVSLAWAAWRRRRSPAGRTPGAAGHSLGRSRALAGAAAVLAVAAVTGTAASSVAAPDRQRFSLREVVQPPVDPRAYPSPLAGFRHYVKDLADTPLFTVDGLPPGARVRLATLDSYDGVVWQVAEPNSGSGTGNFLTVGETTGDRTEGTPAQVTVTVNDYTGVWLPTVGQSTRVRFEGPNATALAGAFSYNAASGTGLTTRPVRSGDRYVLDAVIAQQPSDTAVGSAAAAPVTLPEPQQVPPAVAEIAGELTAEAATPVARARALQAGLAEQGFFSHGLEGDPPSRAGHGADRIAALLGAEQMVGDEEQYAATMALMARRLGLPARVVMGFVPEGSGHVTVTGDDVSAWTEVAFAGQGWVVFDPAPDESRVPQQEAPKPRSQPRPQVQQPPPPLEEPDEPPPASGADTDRRDGDDGGVWDTVLTVAVYVGLPLLVLLGPCALLVALKLRRRRRRASTGAPSARIAGGWSEVVDAARDLGVRPLPRGTRRETAHVLHEAYGTTGAVALAERADAGVFAPGEPSEQEVAHFWAEVERSLRGMSGSVSRWRRLRGWLSPASLRRKGR
jgi:transglutaminase-like putative cysteine protease